VIKGVGDAVLNAEYKFNVSPAANAVSVKAALTDVPAVGLVTNVKVPNAVVPFFSTHADAPPSPVALQLISQSWTVIGCSAVKIPASGTVPSDALVPIEQRENENIFLSP
jgi:hypothetical protein